MAIAHGTRSKYVLEKCRCAKCLKANREYLRVYRSNGKPKKKGSPK